MEIFSWTIICSVLFLVAEAQETINQGSAFGIRYSNTPYKTGGYLSAYEKERCKLDIYIPKLADKPPFPVVIYFHGGSLTSGDKTEGWADWSNYFGFRFLENGIAMVTINYRLSGKEEIKWPIYIEDAAEAVAWVAKHIEEYGGDSNNIFIMGFSAGAYLTHMLSVDPRWYMAINFDSSQIKGYIPISGQTRAHPTVAADLQIQPNDLMSFRADAMPLGHIQKTSKPIYIFVGEEEGQTITDNYAYYTRLTSNGSSNIFIYTEPKKNHIGMRDGLGDINSPTRTKIVEFIRNYSTYGIQLPNIG